jgi:hypothetical protein
MQYYFAILSRDNLFTANDKKMNPNQNEFTIPVIAKALTRIM